MDIQKILFSFFLFSFLISCKSGSNEPPIKSTNNFIKHAQGFDVQSHEGFTKLIIKAPYPNAKEQFEYALINRANEIPEAAKKLPIIRIPIEQLVVTSTTHIPMLELLGEETSLVGFPNTKYISSPKTIDRVKNGHVREIGKEENINTEILMELQPELVVGFAMTSNNGMFTTIEKMGIPVLLNGDWLEKTPLGRAEWIKFFGLLFDKETKADSIFKKIETAYDEAVTLAKDATTSPTILSGVQFKDIWNLPAGESFVAQFLKDANTNYLWAESKGNGSLSLSFESVFEKGKEADFWIAPGHYSSYAQLKEANSHYTQFDAFTNRKLFSFNNKKGENGGVLYYELAPIQPHIVLKDIIKIVHPELLPQYTPFFLEPLQN